MMKRSGNKSGSIAFLILLVLIFSAGCANNSPPQESPPEVEPTEQEETWEQQVRAVPELSFSHSFPRWGEVDFVAVRTGFHLHFYLQRSGETIYTFPESLVSSLFWTHDKLEEELFEETIYLIDEAAVYDVNGDGLEDIIILAYGTLGNGVYPNAYVTVFLQEEDSFVATEALGDQMNVLSGVGSLIEVTDVANVQVYYLTMAEVLDYLGEGNLLQDD